MVMRNTFTYKICNGMADGTDLCFDKNFLSKSCEMFPVKLMKLLRLPLRNLMSLNSEMSIPGDVRIIFLVRDPRAVMNSRKSLEWCNNSTVDCSSAKRLCDFMLEDFKAATEIKRKYPASVIILKYEDLAADLIGTSKKLFSDLGLVYTNETDYYIRKHISFDSTSSFSTYKNPVKHIDSWKTQLSGEKITHIENIPQCVKIMRIFNYAKS